MVEFKRGDLVKLNSGGPIMTICEVSSIPHQITGKDETVVTCNWFNKEDKIEHYDFYIEEIVPYKN